MMYDCSFKPLVAAISAIKQSESQLVKKAGKQPSIHRMGLILAYYGVQSILSGIKGYFM